MTVPWLYKVGELVRASTPFVGDTDWYGMPTDDTPVPEGTFGVVIAAFTDGFQTQNDYHVKWRMQPNGAHAVDRTSSHFHK